MPEELRNARFASNIINVFRNLVGVIAIGNAETHSFILLG